MSLADVACAPLASRQVGPRSQPYQIQRQYLTVLLVASLDSDLCFAASMKAGDPG